MGGGRYEPETPHQFQLGPGARIIGVAWFAGLFALSTLLPYFAMLVTSIADQWQGALPSLTLDHYRAILIPGSRGTEALFTSLWLAFAAATISIFLGAWIAYVISRTHGWLRHALEGLATLPRVIPKIVLAVGLILAWNAFWVPVSPYNTVWMLLLAYVVIYITDALNYANSRLQSMDPALEHAASILGASRWRVFFQVVLPQLKPVLLAAWLTTFIVTMRELVASILLLPPGVDTSATFIFNQFEQGDLAVAMAMASITIALSSIVLVVFQIRSRPRAPT
ncbi:iron ABC transporter permease [Thioalkalivibrio sp. ALE28]|uniref:ABC transporter permease n=1 Tax=Thioalkalivibrio sp. ALE28 TaxID=1158179 RepID=UPI0003640210|nr:ABC transporter permease subunit [Thioalkalivibrio sp. ALE28]